MQLLDLCKQLLSRPSLTPNDAGCQELIATILGQNGFAIEQTNIGETKNLLAIKGNPKAAALVLLGHTDVVPPGDNWQTEPFKPEIVNEKLYARGAVDMKVAVACMIKTACELDLRQGRIAIMLTSDEEGHGNDGIFKVLPNWHKKIGSIKACLVGEPTSNKKLGDTIKLGRRGSINGVIEITGQQGHAAYPELVNSSITDAAKFIAVLENHVWDKSPVAEFPATRLVCTGLNSMSHTCNVIPACTRIYFNIRYNPGIAPGAIKEEIQKLAKNHSISYQWQIWQPSNGGPYQTKPQQLTKSLMLAIEQFTGITPEFSYDGGTSDGRFMAEFCSEVVEFGALRNYAHKTDEHISLHEIDLLYNIYSRACQEFIYQNLEQLLA